MCYNGLMKNTKKEKTIICSCCKKEKRLKDLTFIGVQVGKFYQIDLHNCSCGTTIGTNRVKFEKPKEYIL
jgi:hypothetical protein